MLDRRTGLEPAFSSITLLDVRSGGGGGGYRRMDPLAGL